MSDKLRKQVHAEMTQLHQLAAGYQELLMKCAKQSPSFIEMSALAALLHSLYTGFENILKRIAVETGESVPQGESWHSDLLRQLSRPAPHRPRAISDSLHARLTDYLAFRHVFRGSVLVTLVWERMQPLALDFPHVLAAFEAEIEEFLRVRDAQLGAPPKSERG